MALLARNTGTGDSDGSGGTEHSKINLLSVASEHSKFNLLSVASGFTPDVILSK